MNSATANLENDHVHIIRLIGVMEKIAQAPEPDIENIETIVDLIRNFADGLHHNKEEKLLFLKMAERGFSFQQGPVAVMMNEHVQGRDYVKGIAENLAMYKSGNTTVTPAIFRNMLGYTALLRAHIAKENNVLFRMADNALSDEEQQALLKEFNKLEYSNESGRDVTGFIKQIDDLDARYL